MQSPDTEGTPRVDTAALASTSDPVDLAVALMSVDSTSGSERAVVSLVAEILRRRGWGVYGIPVSPGRESLLALDRDGGLPAVTLSTHLDTVPPYIPPRVDTASGRLYGRGACDAKGIAAAMLLAAERLRADGVATALLFVVGEETQHDGAFVAGEAIRTGQLGLTSTVLINGEPTEGRLASGTKGALRFTIRTTGRAAHSAYPELGSSATSVLVRLLVELEQLPLPTHPVLGTTTINIGRIEGGIADNVVAPRAEAGCMARLVGPADELLHLLNEWAGDRAEITPVMTVPPVLLGELPGFESEVMAYATDIPLLEGWGRPYLFGPGSIHVAHTDGEYVDIAELRASVDAYVRLARAALAET